MICRPDVRFEEKEAGVLERPVFGDGVFFRGVGGGFDVFDNGLEGSVVTDEFQGGAGADALNGV